MHASTFFIQFLKKIRAFHLVNFCYSIYICLFCHKQEFQYCIMYIFIANIIDIVFYVTLLLFMYLYLHNMNVYKVQNMLRNPSKSCIQYIIIFIVVVCFSIRWVLDIFLNDRYRWDDNIFNGSKSINRSFSEFEGSPNR